MDRHQGREIANTLEAIRDILREIADGMKPVVYVEPCPLPSGPTPTPSVTIRGKVTGGGTMLCRDDPGQEGGE